MKTNEQKQNFNAKLIAKMGIFTAISFALTYVEIPMFLPFLKLDFSNVFVLIGGFSLGTVPGIIILIMKEILCLLKTTTVVGQLANVIIGLSYLIVPFLLYDKKRSIEIAILGLVIGTIIQSIASLPVNAFINFPLYGADMAYFKDVWYFILAFNAIKGLSVSFLTLLLYKRVKVLLNF